MIDDAVNHAKKGEYTKAYKLFIATDLEKKSAEALSYYALSVAAATKDFDRASKLSAMAFKDEGYDPALYLNAGKIQLLAGKKELAIKTFKKGLKLDPENTLIKKQLAALGVRKNPVIPFLSRNNPINRFLGKLKHSPGKTAAPAKKGTGKKP